MIAAAARASVLGGTEIGHAVSNERPNGPLMATVRWQDKAQMVSLRRSRLQHAAVEVAVIFRIPDGRYVHRRARCSGRDLKRPGIRIRSQPRGARARR